MESVEKKKKQAVDLCSRPLLKKTILFSLPLLATSVLQLLYNAADIVVLGQFADESQVAVAAVGSTNSLINLIINLFIGLSVGALAVVARYVGARNSVMVSKTVHTSVCISIIGGFIVGLIGFFLAESLLKLMGTPEDVLPLSTLYLKIYFCGMPFNLLYNFGASILRACGDTRRPLLILIVAGVANIGLNILLVAACNMSVAGVAIATTISQVISAAGVVIFLMRRKDAARLSIKKLRIHKSALVDIIRIGLPAGIQGTVFSLSNVIIQSSINSFGKVAMAGNAAAASVEGFVYVSMNAISQACLTVAGQNYGAAKPENISLTFIQCLALTTGIGLVLGVGAYLLSDPLLRLYGCSDEAVAYGTERLKVICNTYFLCGIMEVVVGVLRAMGRSVMPMIVTLLGVCGVRILWIYTAFAAYHTPFMLYISYPISWAIAFGVHLICFFAVKKKVYRELNESRRQSETTIAETADCASCSVEAGREYSESVSHDDNAAPQCVEKTQ